MFKMILEIFPLICFFYVYHIKGMIIATAVMIFTTLISILILYILHRKVSAVTIFSAIVLATLGGISIFSGNTVFIKIKPTILNMLFASVLLISLFFDKNILKSCMGNIIEMNAEAWKILTIRWSVLFIFLAILNEIVWRNFSEAFWVNFKVFFSIPIILVFTLFQVSFIKKNSNIDI